MPDIEYINPPWHLVPEPPYSVGQIRMGSFALQADEDRLRKLCDRVLNLGDVGGVAASGQPVEYRVFTSTVLLTAMTIGHLSSAAVEDSQRGWATENEVDLWIPLLARHRDENGQMVEHLVWHTPVLWVDSDIAFAAGRETYGYPKRPARITVPDSFRPGSGTHPGKPGIWKVESNVFPRFDSTTRMVNREVLRIEPSAGDATPGAQGYFPLLEWIGSWLSWDMIKGVISDPAILRSVAFDALTLRGRAVFLRQIRDPGQPRVAAYQAIIEAGLRLDSFFGGGILDGTYDIHLANFDSDPWRDALGLTEHPAGSGVVARGVRGAWADYCLTLETGYVVHRRA